MSKELSFSDLKEIASILRDADNLSEFSMKFENLEISLTRSIQFAGAQGQKVCAESSAVAADNTATEKIKSSSVPIGENVGQVTTLGAVPIVEGAHVVRSPMVGTFYRSPEPGAKPFVKIGSHVKKGDVICLIEVMKLINSIVAEGDGEIVEIYVDNEGVVEFGQPLMTIRPH
jgi:acetyl-CoA carboxylase biotin carboxyl carrier protein